MLDLQILLELFWKIELGYFIKNYLAVLKSGNVSQNVAMNRAAGDIFALHNQQKHQALLWVCDQRQGGVELRSINCETKSSLPGSRGASPEPAI